MPQKEERKKERKKEFTQQTAVPHVNGHVVPCFVVLRQLVFVALLFLAFLPVNLGLLHSGDFLFLLQLAQHSVQIGQLATCHLPAKRSEA